MPTPAPSPEQVEAAREFFGCIRSDRTDTGIYHSELCRQKGPGLPVWGCEALTALLLRRDREAMGRAAAICRGMGLYQSEKFARAIEERARGRA